MEQTPAALPVVAYSITAKGLFGARLARRYSAIIHAGIGHLTLAADPDGLLPEAALHEAIHGRGFEIVTFKDPVAFRFDYESRFRSRQDRGEGGTPEVVVRIASMDLSTLPHDLLQTGRPISFGLSDLFPDLSYPIVAAIDRSELDALHCAQERYKPNQLGADATKDFLLRHVFDLAPELVKNPSDLLRVLLRRHYRRQRLPRLFDDRLAWLLRRGSAFVSWPLKTIIPNRDAFFAFLRERWPLFLDRLAGTQTTVSLQDVEEKFGFEIGGTGGTALRDRDAPYGRTGSERRIRNRP